MVPNRDLRLPALSDVLKNRYLFDHGAEKSPGCFALGQLRPDLTARVKRGRSNRLTPAGNVPWGTVDRPSGKDVLGIHKTRRSYASPPPSPTVYYLKPILSTGWRRPPRRGIQNLPCEL